MSGILVVALVVSVVFCMILIVLWRIKPSDQDAVTQEVIEQALTGPVSLPPARARLDAPNRHADGDDEKPT